MSIIFSPLIRRIIRRLVPRDIEDFNRKSRDITAALIVSYLMFGYPRPPTAVRRFFQELVKHETYSIYVVSKYPTAFISLPTYVEKSVYTTDRALREARTASLYAVSATPKVAGSAKTNAIYILSKILKSFAEARTLSTYSIFTYPLTSAYAETLSSYTLQVPAKASTSAETLSSFSISMMSAVAAEALTYETFTTLVEYPKVTTDLLLATFVSESLLSSPEGIRPVLKLADKMSTYALYKRPEKVINIKDYTSYWVE